MHEQYSVPFSHRENGGRPLVACQQTQQQDIFSSRYIFPTSMAKCLLQKSLETPLVHIEDIYLTGILAEKCGFEKGHIPGIFKIPEDPCNYPKETFIAHAVKPEDQPLMQEILTKRRRTKCDQRPRRSCFV